MDFAIWAYPWDLLDEGVENVAERLRNLGIGEINLATQYHTVQTFLPHNPERRTFFAHSSAYFQPREEYGPIQPVTNEQMGNEDWVEAIGEKLSGTGLSLNSWTVGCHNSRLGMKHPEATLRNAHGDSLAFGLCPSNPDVQTYLGGLLRDLNDRNYFDRIELESFDYFFGSGFGWHHDKFHTRLGTLGKFLFGLCFCEHCRENATSAGVDVERAQTTCARTVDELAEGTLPHQTDVGGWIQSHPVVAEYASIRKGTLTQLFTDLSAEVDAAELGCYVGFFGIEDSWMLGVDLEALADLVDDYTVIAYESTRGEAVDRLRTARHLTPEIPLHAGVLPAHPAVYDAATLRSIVEGLIEEGAPRISFYNYGLLPERNLEWIAAATKPYR